MYSEMVNIQQVKGSGRERRAWLFGQYSSGGVLAPNDGCCTCQQGAAGPAGPPGANGKDGANGDDGETGPDGELEGYSSRVSCSVISYSGHILEVFCFRPENFIAFDFDFLF